MRYKKIELLSERRNKKKKKCTIREVSEIIIFINIIILAGLN